MSAFPLFEGDTVVVWSDKVPVPVWTSALVARPVSRTSEAIMSDWLLVARSR